MDYSVSGSEISFTSPPPSNTIINIWRETPTERLVSWTDASVLRGADMTVAQVQQLHIIEESTDSIKRTSMVTDSTNGHWQGRDKRITNVSNPVDSNDVVTKGYIEGTQSNLINTMTAVKDTCTTDLTALLTQGTVSSNKATLEATRATTEADRATREAALASTSATAAAQSESNAATSATTATEKATIATAGATLASNKANDVSALADVVISKSTQASTSATAAAQSESKAAASAATATLSATTATEKATIATNNADRAKSEADRAAAYVGSATMLKPSTNEVVFDLADFTSDNIYFGYRGLENKANAINTYTFWNGKRGPEFGGTAANIAAKSFIGNASSASKLATPRTINGVPFDGSSNISFGQLEPVRIAANTDLNNIIQPGMYHGYDYDNVGTLLNSPTIYSFSLLVEKTVYRDGYKQTLSEGIAPGKTFFRKYINKTWSPWYQNVDSNNIASQNVATVGGKKADNTNGNLTVWPSDGKLTFPNGTQFWIE